MNEMNKNVTTHCGDSAEILKQYPDNYFHSVVCDPPYLIGFLNKDWDKSTNCLMKVFLECHRVLRPGGHILAFTAARTYHKLAQQIENSGFEIRDMLMWLYATGFPKGLDAGRHIQKKFGVELTKPLHPSLITKTATHVNNGGNEFSKSNPTHEQIAVTHPLAKPWEGWKTGLKPAHEPIVMGRKDLISTVADNILEFETGALNIDECRIALDKIQKASNQVDDLKEDLYPTNVIGEVTGHQKHFFCPKISVSERNLGIDISDRNNHPTVKPVELMRYLVKLVTPKGGTVLDPFMGSGSTGMACVGEGMNFVGIDLNPDYVNIANKRINAYQEIIKKETVVGNINKKRPQKFIPKPGLDKTGLFKRKN